MNSINFTANLVKRTQIQKTEDFKNYNPKEASIVELDKYDERDLNSLYKTVVLWNDQNAKYSSSIYHEAIKGYEYDDIEQEHYFALTTQKGNFKELDPNKILGLMLFSQTNAKEDEINCHDEVHKARKERLYMDCRGGRCRGGRRPSDFPAARRQRPRCDTRPECCRAF